jgi:hypothetical protein
MMGVTLIPLPGNFGICRLAPGDPLPAWAVDGLFLSVTRTVDELSIVCGEASVPENVRCERGWRCLRVGGTLDFSLIGVVASLVGPLADASLSVFVFSTFDTDYLLVKEQDFEPAIEVLQRHGHSIAPPVRHSSATSSRAEPADGH